MPINVRRNAICLGSAAFLALAIGASPAWSGEPATECDTLGASALDTSRPAGVAGTEFSAIDASIALPACNEAYEANKDDPRVAFQLARVLQKSAEEARERAQALYVESAKGGHPLAMVNLASLLESSDPVQAFEWYEKSAALGNSLGQFNLAYAYQYGQGTDVDVNKAIEFYTKSMDQGDIVAPHNLAVIYDEGKLVPRDMAKAIPLYELAAERGYRDAIFNLALALQKGDGVTADPARALALFEKGASLGDKDAAKVVEMLKAAQ